MTWQTQVAAWVAYATAAGVDDVFLVSAPAATGKTELARHLEDMVPDSVLVSEPASGFLRSLNHDNLVIADGASFASVRTLVEHHRGPLLALHCNPEVSRLVHTQALKRSGLRHYIKVEVLDDIEGKLPRPAKIVSWLKCGPNYQAAR